MAPEVWFRFTKIFIAVDSVFWLAWAAVVGLGLHPALPDEPAIRLVMVGMAVAAAIGMPVLLVLARRFSRRWAVLLAVGLGVIVFLTITDEFGIVDAAVLAFHLAPLTFLILGIRGYPRTS